MEFRFNHSPLLFGFFVLLMFGGCGSERAEAPAVEAAVPSFATDVPAKTRQRILFFGDSITAGYGLDPVDAYPALIQEEIEKRDWPFEAVGAGVSGETSAGGLRRIDWVLRNPVDVLVLELGANDGLRLLPVTGMKDNLVGIVKKVRAKNPEVSVVIAGMRMPPNLGPHYAARFNEAFAEVAEATDAVLIPFLLEDVAGRTLLNQFDGIHPTARGQKRVAETVWKYLEPILVGRMQGEQDS